MDAVFPLLSAIALLLLPGAAVLFALRARQSLLLASAPPMTALVLLLLSVLHKLLDIRWSLVSVVIGSAVIAVLAHVVRRFLRGSRAHSGPQTAAREPAGSRLRCEALINAGAVIAGIAIVVPALIGMGGIGTMNGSYDAFFHHSALAFIRADGDAFPLTAMAPMYGGDASYYPTTWHMIAALVPGDVVTSANATMLAGLGMLPVSVAAMLYALVPGRQGDLVRAVAIFICTCATAMLLSVPATALVFGLWPFALATALLPTAVASLPDLLDARRSRWDRAIGALIILGVLSVHPSIASSFALVVLVITGVAGLVLAARRQSRRKGAILLIAAVAASGFALAVAWRALPEEMSALTKQEGLGALNVLLVLFADRPRIRAVAFDPLPWLPIAALAAIGIATASRRRSVPVLSAVLVGAAAVALTFATQSTHPLIRALSAPWYGARERIEPLFVLPMLLLAASGATTIGQLVRDRLGERGGRRVLALVVVVAIACTALIAPVPNRIRHVASMAYTAWGRQLYPYVTASERAFIERSARALPKGSVVLGDPRDGTSAYWSLGGVEVVYPSLARPQSLDERRVAHYANQYMWDERVCTSMKMLGVTHVYRDASKYRGTLFGDAEDDAEWEGITGIDVKQLTLVAEDGPYRLYRVGLPCAR